MNWAKLDSDPKNSPKWWRLSEISNLKDNFKSILMEFNMAKTFEGNVSIYKNSKEKIVVKGDPKGNYNAENVDELVKVMTELGTKLKCECNFFIPETLPKSELKAVLLMNRWGAPYVAMLPESKSVAKATIQKLA